MQEDLQARFPCRKTIHMSLRTPGGTSLGIRNKFFAIGFCVSQDLGPTRLAPYSVCHKTLSLTQNQHKTAKPAEISLGILVLALSVESASSADVYNIIGAGCWVGIPSREFSVGVESWIGILNSAAQNQHKTAKPAETSRHQHKTSSCLSSELSSYLRVTRCRGGVLNQAPTQVLN